MKHFTKITSLIIAVIMCLTLMLTTAFALGSTSSNDTASSNKNPSQSSTVTSCSSDDSKGLILDTSKTFFSKSENLILNFSVESESKISSYDYEQDGISTVSVLKSQDENNIVFTAHRGLASSSNSHYATFYLRITLVSGENLSSTVFIYLGEEGSAINSHSHNEAERKYYYNLYSQGKLTKNEFDSYVNEIYEDCATETFELSERHADIIAKNPEKIANRARKTITGELLWEDSWGSMHPLRYVKVELYTTYNSTLLSTTYSDSHGIYQFTSINLSSNQLNVYIKIYAGDDNAIVCHEEDSLSDVWYATNPYVRTTTAVTASNAITVINSNFDMTTELGQAMQISQALFTARDYAWNMKGGEIESTLIRFPKSNIANYDDVYNQINIPSMANVPEDERRSMNPYESWDVIMHEYGHFVEDLYYMDDSNTSAHNSVLNMSDFLSNSYEGLKISWEEAWATVFAFAAQEYFYWYVYDVYGAADTVYDAYNYDYATSSNINSTSQYAPYDIETTPVRLGDACERSIMAVLWDIYDTVNETNDNVGLGAYDFWNLSTSGGIITFSHFINELYAEYPEIKDDLGSSLTYYKMAASEPTISNQYSATTPPHFTWVANGGSTQFPNNSFVFECYTAAGSLIFSKTLDENELTLTTAEWNSILSGSGNQYYVVIASTAISYSETMSGASVTVSSGPYYTAPKWFSKP